MPTDRQVETHEQRLDCIEQFLDSPNRVPLPKPTVGQGFYFDGLVLSTKPLNKARNRQGAIVGIWKNGIPHLHNTRNPLGRDTLKRAHEKGMEVIVVS